MEISELKQWFETNKETQLYHRYITNQHIEPLLETLKKKFVVEVLGASVLRKPIYGITLGSGPKRLLFWSQMHGNETTTTKALFDVLQTFYKGSDSVNHILKACTLYIIPILNPDGAEAYTRLNANLIDLNRDAQALSQPESILLRTVFNQFKPHYCYNLHGQRTIFSAGNVKNPATVSFLAPAQDDACTVTETRKIAMEIITVMNAALQTLIPEQVGVYDDVFNLNCVGDTFQSLNIPTILFEAGHFPEDYAREKTRLLIYVALLTSINYISRIEVTGNGYASYFNIPQNKKRFFDLIIRNAKVKSEPSNTLQDIGILYQEVLKDGRVDFIPKIEKIEPLIGFFGHQELDAEGFEVLTQENKPLQIGNENVFVLINNRKISLLLK